MGQCPNIEYKLEESFAFIAGRSALALSRIMEQKFREAGNDITSEQWSVLVKLWETDGKTQQELCCGTNKDKPSITRLIDNLERSNLVVRIPDKDDRRINLIYLTPKGKEMKSALMEIALETYKTALDGIKDENVLIARDVLIKVFNNITK